MFSPESEIFLWKKPKKKKKTFFVESLDQCRRLKVREKARNVFSDEPTSVWPHGVTQHRIFIKFFFHFTRIFSLFSLVFHTSNFWSLRNLIKQLFHSRLLDMWLGIANSALRASLAIYHLISNADTSIPHFEFHMFFLNVVLFHYFRKIHVTFQVFLQHVPWIKY